MKREISLVLQDPPRKHKVLLLVLRRLAIARLSENGALAIECTELNLGLRYSVSRGLTSNDSDVEGLNRA